MKNYLLILASLMLVGFTAKAQQVEFEEFDLDNGLHVILHQDNTAPVVTVGVMYDVGGKDLGGTADAPRTGFAHFFEHLLFEGTKNIDRGEWFKIVSSNGGSNNANTSLDRTYYYEVFPSNNLELGLWMESERMMHPVIDQVGVDTQNEVVKEEKRLRYDNSPYGQFLFAVSENLFKNHPYANKNIGEMADLDASTLEEFQKYFKDWYGPNNAALVVAGDINIEEAKELVKKYFAAIESRPVPSRNFPKENPITEKIDAKFYDSNIQIPAIITAYRTPGFKERDAYVLSMVSAYLSDGKTSKLYKKIVDEKKMALQVGAINIDQMDYGIYAIYGLPLGETTLKDLLAEMDSEIVKMQNELISENDHKKLQNKFENRFVNSNASIEGIANSLVRNYVLYDDINLINSEIEIYRSITRQEIQDVVKKYLNPNQRVELEYLPKEKLTTKKYMKMNLKISVVLVAFFMSVSAFAQLDRSKMPEPGPAPKISLEKPEEFKLKNGLTVLVVENHKLPRVSYSLTIDNKPMTVGEKAGVESIIGTMLGNGTKNISKDEFNEEVDFLGARLRFSSRGGFASSLSKYSDRILELMANAAISPLLTEEEFEKEKAKLIDGLKTEEKSVDAVASRVGSALAYGKKHPYGEFTTEATVTNVTYGDAVAFYEQYFNPNNAYLVVVGDVDYKEVKNQIEKHFSKWEKSVGVDYTVPNEAPNAQYAQINFVDMPNAVQSNISITNNVDLQMKDDDYHAVLIANRIFGGDFNSYLNMNLREANGYTYGARSSVGTDKYASRFRAGAAVRNMVTDSAVVNTLKEMNRIRTEPIEPETLKNVKAAYVGQFVMALENPQTIARYALNIKLNDLPDDFYTTYLQKINAVTAEDVNRVANKYFKPENARIVVIGKGSEVLENLEKTGIPIKYYDKYATATEKPTYEIDMPVDMDATKVMQSYIDAVGGRAALDKVNSVFMIAEAELQPGVMMNLEMKKTSKDQVMSEITAMGQSMMKSVVNPEGGYIVQQGQRKEMTPDELKIAKVESSPFPEVNYLSGGATLEKIENIDGDNAYKIKVGENKTLYYNVATGLKIKQIETSEAGSQSIFFADYKDVEGIMFPFKIGQTAGPRRFDFVVKSVQINEGVTDADFD